MRIVEELQDIDKRLIEWLTKEDLSPEERDALIKARAEPCPGLFGDANREDSRSGGIQEAFREHHERDRQDPDEASREPLPAT